MRTLTKKKQVLALLIVSGAYATVCQVQAAVILFDTTSLGGNLNDQEINVNLWAGQSFIVPSGNPNANKWVIDNIQLQLNAGIDSSGYFEVRIYPSTTVGGYLTPDTASPIINTLSGSANPNSAQLYTYTPSGGAGTLTLNAGTYWVVAGVTSSAGDYGWTYTDASGPASPGGSTEVAFTIGSGSGPTSFQTAGEFHNQGTDVTPSLMVINGIAVPEPSTYGLIAGLGLLGFAGWRRYSRK